MSEFLRDRITCIELIDDNFNYTALYRKFHNKLYRYPNLKEIVIHTYKTDIHFKNVTKYFEDIIENRLVSLQHLSVASRNDSTRLQLSTVNGNALLFTLNTIYITKQSKCHYVPSEEFMLFIMNKFPNLDKLLCKETSIHRTHCVATPSESLTIVLFQFIKFLSQMSTYFFPNIVLPTVNAIKLIEDFYADADEDSMSRSLTIVNTFYASEEPNHTTVLCFENRPSKIDLRKDGTYI